MGRPPSNPPNRRSQNLRNAVATSQVSPVVSSTQVGWPPSAAPNASGPWSGDDASSPSTSSSAGVGMPSSWVPLVELVCAFGHRVDLPLRSYLLD